MQQYCETISNGTPKSSVQNGAGLNFLNFEKSLIICADDFALNDGVSQAIAQLSDHARISATSVMTLSPSWSSHAALLRGQKQAIDVGLHLDLTSEFARTAGYGTSLNQVLVRAFTYGINAFEMDAIIHAQLDRFETVWGDAPDHIDGHQHVHQFPGIRDSLMRVICARYSDPRRRPWIRVSRVHPRAFKSNVITLTGANRLRKSLEAEKFNFSPVLLGVYGFDLTLAQYRTKFKHWLEAVNELKEDGLTGLPPCLMCHPGAADADGREDEIARARWVEFAYLSSAEFAQDFSAAALKLVRGKLVRGSQLDTHLTLQNP